MTTALVTGGAGFLGSHLAEHLLDAGYDVVIVDRVAPAEASNVLHLRDHLRYVCADLTARDGLAGVPPVDVVFHFAANANVARSSRDPAYDAETNITATVRVLELAREQGCRVLLASSAAVYGDPLYVPTDEAHPTVPASPYGMSKLAAEGYARLWRRLWSVPTQVVRYFNAYGERQRRFAVWDFAEKLHRPGAELEVLGSGRQQRTMLHAADAARATLLVAESGVPGPINVGGSDALTVLELLDRVQRAFGIERAVRCTGSSWPGDVARMIPDVSVLRALGFEERVPLDVGLARFRDWYLAERRDVGPAVTQPTG